MRGKKRGAGVSPLNRRTQMSVQLKKAAIRGRGRGGKTLCGRGSSLRGRGGRGGTSSRGWGEEL